MIESIYSDDDQRTFHRTVAVLREFGSIVTWVKLITIPAVKPGDGQVWDRVGVPANVARSNTPTKLTRAEMKALPIAQITAPTAQHGALTVLSIAHESRLTRQLYAQLADLSRYYRAVADDPVKATFADRHIRSIWSRLVARSHGYWLHGLGFREYAPDV